jgi:predicted metal-dependent peptidase
VNTKARKRMVAHRTLMVMDLSFWGSLALKLKLVESTRNDTAWTDGVNIGYNVDFILSLTKQELIALWAHEVAHCVLGHPWRRGSRNPKRWNRACDIAINDMLRAAGFILPDGALYAETFDLPEGKSAEWYYDRIPVNPEDAQGGSGQGGEGNQSGTPKLGDVFDAPRPEKGEGEDGAGAGEAPTEEDWKQAAEQMANVVKAMGSAAGGMDRLVDTALKGRVDWQSVMHRFATERARVDYTWARPNPRYLSSGLYLPALGGEEMGCVAIGVDVSGSIDKVLYNQFGAEVKVLVEELQPREVHVFHCDTRVTRHDVFYKGDVVDFPKVQAGGGTDFRPVFDEIDKLDERPVCILYLTDLAGRYPEESPEIPTLWVTARDDPWAAQYAPPFGEVVTAG